MGNMGDIQACVNTCEQIVLLIYPAFFCYEYAFGQLIYY